MLCLAPSLYNEHKLAARFVGFEMCRYLFQRAAHTFFVQLGNLAAGGAAAVAAKDLCQLAQGFRHAIGRLVDDHGTRFLGEGGEARGASFLLRQEALEGKPLAGQARRHQGRHERRCARQALHLHIARHASADQHKSGVANARRAGVRHEHHGFIACGQPFCYRLGRLVLVELMVRLEPRLDVVMLEQHTRRARILSQHEVGGLEQFEGAERDVSEVAHGRGHEIKFSHAAKV